MEFGFAAIEYSLAKHFGIRDDARSAFAARIKHLQRNGFPPGTNTGRGRAAVYTVEHLLMLSMAFELISLGINPERAAESVGRHWPTLKRAIMQVVDAFEAGKGSALLAVTYFDGLTDLTKDQGASRYGAVFAIDKAKLHQALGRPAMKNKRVGLFSLTNAITIPLRYLAGHEKIHPVALMAEAGQRLRPGAMDEAGVAVDNVLKVQPYGGDLGEQDTAKL